MEPPEAEDWLALTTEVLPVDRALSWAVTPGCGAVVLFCGTVRDHADGRDGVISLDYEAYESQVLPRLEAIAVEARKRWPKIGRLALLHRVGRLELGETSVAVVASTPHRAEAFDSAHFAIDALKSTVPIWKKETWADGAGWGTGATEPTDVGSLRPRPGRGPERVSRGPGRTGAEEEAEHRTVAKEETEQRSGAWPT